MSKLTWRELTVMSVTDPAQAARTLMALGLRRDLLWTGLALAVVLNTLLFSLSNILMPGPTPFPAAFNQPMVYLTLVAGGLLLTVYTLYGIGRLLGGKGALDDVLVLVLWLQYLRILVQVATLILALTVPLLALLTVLGATLVGIYVMLHFVDQAHRLGSLPRAAGVLIASVVAMALALFVLMALFGGTIFGPVSHV